MGLYMAAVDVQSDNVYYTISIFDSALPSNEDRSFSVGPDMFSIQYEGGGGDDQPAIITSTCRISIFIDHSVPYLVDFLNGAVRQTTEDRFYIAIYRKTGPTGASRLFWGGRLVNDHIRVEDDGEDRYFVVFTFHDGLAALKAKRLSIGHEGGRLSIQISRCLDYLNMHLVDLYWSLLQMITVDSYKMNNDPNAGDQFNSFFYEALIDTNRWFEMVDEGLYETRQGIYVYDIMESIARSTFSRIYPWGGVHVMEQYQSLISKQGVRVLGFRQDRNLASTSLYSHFNKSVTIDLPGDSQPGQIKKFRGMTMEYVRPSNHIKVKFAEPEQEFYTKHVQQVSRVPVTETFLPPYDPYSGAMGFMREFAWPDNVENYGISGWLDLYNVHAQRDKIQSDFGVTPTKIGYLVRVALELLDEVDDSTTQQVARWTRSIASITENWSAPEGYTLEVAYNNPVLSTSWSDQAFIGQFYDFFVILDVADGNRQSVPISLPSDGTTWNTALRDGNLMRGWAFAYPIRYQVNQGTQWATISGAQEWLAYIGGSTAYIQADTDTLPNSRGDEKVYELTTGRESFNIKEWEIDFGYYLGVDNRYYGKMQMTNPIFGSNNIIPIKNYYYEPSGVLPGANGMEKIIALSLQTLYDEARPVMHGTLYDPNGQMDYSSDILRGPVGNRDVYKMGRVLFSGKLNEWRGNFIYYRKEGA